MKYPEWKQAFVDGVDKTGIIELGGDAVGVLPKTDKVVIPVEKFVNYALNPNKQPNKALAFQHALGYNIDNASQLIEQIRENVCNFPAVAKDDIGYGLRYEVVMNVTGVNGKTAKVLTAWIDDASNGEMRLTSVYVDK